MGTTRLTLRMSGHNGANPAQKDDERHNNEYCKTDRDVSESKIWQNFGIIFTRDPV